MRYIKKNRIKRLKKRQTFKNIAHYGTCAVCHSWAPVASLPSINTNVWKFYCCEKCANEGLEPYDVCVDAAAYSDWKYMSRWKKEKIQTMLPKFQRTEEEFLEDVAARVRYYDEFLPGRRILYIESY